MRSVREELSDEVRRHIVLALEGYSQQAIFDVLLEVLRQRERDYRIRLNAVCQLWKHDPAVVAPSLEATVMSDDHPLVRLHAADSLELIGELLPFEPSRRAFWRGRGCWDFSHRSDRTTPNRGYSSCKSRGAPGPSAHWLRLE